MVSCSCWEEIITAHSEGVHGRSRLLNNHDEDLRNLDEGQAKLLGTLIDLKIKAKS